MSNQKEFGRPTKFFWKQDDFEKGNDWFEVFIADQDTSIKGLWTSYSQIKRFVEYIEFERGLKEVKRKRLKNE